MIQAAQKKLMATGDPTLALSPQQRAFVENIVAGMNQTVAARTAGYATPSVDAVRLMKLPMVVQSLQVVYKKHEKAAQMTRKKVMDGMLEAIEMAKLQGEPGVMVAGWREVGRMCGYYAPEKKVIDINITAKRAVDRMEQMSDAELLEMIAEDETALEGECTEILEAGADDY